MSTEPKFIAVEACAMQAKIMKYLKQPLCCGRSSVRAYPLRSDLLAQPALRQPITFMSRAPKNHLSLLAGFECCRLKAAKIHMASVSQHASAPSSQLRILMAEDNLINQRVGKLILTKAGYEVDLVSDGREALEAHRTKPYHLILMDCQMPVMDGFEASRQIRELSGLCQPVIIAVTANALVGERERCLGAGMDDYLSKPFRAHQLISVIRRWVDSKAIVTSG